MSNLLNDPLFKKETTCRTLLYELQVIWDEIGESDADKDKMLQEIEQECIEVYRRKIDKSNQSRTRLRQSIADSEAELAAIFSALGGRPLHTKQPDQNIGSLKDDFKKILLQVEEIKRTKCERRNQFLDVLEKIQRIKTEICGSLDLTPSKTRLDETDLSSRKLEELHRELYELQKEKAERLRLVEDHLFTIKALCLVLDQDFNHIVSEFHVSSADPEGPKDMTDGMIQKLATAIHELREMKLQRMQRLQDLATTMLELWTLLDTPTEEQQKFQNITSNITASEHEITEPKMLSEDIINYVAEEVARLEGFKLSKRKELVLTKRSELEEICRKTHVIPEADTKLECAIEALKSGAVDAACILELIELRIAEVKEEALNRKELLEKIEKWLAACDEEYWLEEYNRNENRFNAGRGAHLILKRAEKARSLAKKLPAIVEALTAKTVAWERERGIEFSYDGIRLLSMLEEYTILGQEREQAQCRLRGRRKLQGQLIAEQEALYGSKPCHSKTQLVKKALQMSTGAASSIGFSPGGATLHTPKPDPSRLMKATPNVRSLRKSDRVNQVDQLNHYRDSGQAALSASRRRLDVAGLPCHSKTQLVKKASQMSTGAASSRGVSPGGVTLHTPKPDPLRSMKVTPNARSLRKSDCVNQVDQLNHYKDNGQAPLSASRRRLDVAGLPCHSKTQLVKKASQMSTGAASSRGVSPGGVTLHTPKPDPLRSMKVTPNARSLRKSDCVNQVDQLNHYKDNGQAPLSASRRRLDVAGLPCHSKTQLVKKASQMSTGAASSRGVSPGGVTLHTPKPDPLRSMKATPNARALRKSDCVNQVDQLNHYKDNGQAALSASRRRLDVAGLPCHSKTQLVKKDPQVSTGAASSRGVSPGGVTLHTPKPDTLRSMKATPNARSLRKSDWVNQVDQLNHYKDNGQAALSASRRGLDAASLPLKMLSTCTVMAWEPDSRMLRKPFSPLPPATGRMCSTNVMVNTSVRQDEPLQNFFSWNVFGTPLKATTMNGEENRTPKIKAIPVPTTPSTISIPVQTSTLALVSCLWAQTLSRKLLKR